jgi:hypothetical protein
MATLRNGMEIATPTKGILGRVLVGLVDGKVMCWRLDGKWRWDDVDHPLDVMSP